MTPEEMDEVSEKVHEKMRREWIALTPAREKRDRTIRDANKEYDRALEKYRKGIMAVES